MYDLIPATATRNAESAADGHAPAHPLIIEDLDGSGDHGVALFTVCVVAAPATGRHAA
ncbi:hypothetical protein [Streptomyces sp. TRM64462]|uniref:hypothetical protein n=1 Tax=Streptomyces sp. TRM64462 TaxID=2741726 RepID=UPI0015862FE1|nr:hypothetical protein [Streptomyces sp. TRM64462]